jgi:hypothetical protein
MRKDSDQNPVGETQLAIPATGPAREPNVTLSQQCFTSMNGPDPKSMKNSNPWSARNARSGPRSRPRRICRDAAPNRSGRDWGRFHCVPSA